MSEIITTYKLTDLDQPIPMDRDEFYDEQIRVFKETGKPTRSTEVVHVILFTKDKEIILQKRSSAKRHNKKLLDKTIGRHVFFGDNPQYTVTLGVLQELKVSSFVLQASEDFKKTYKLLNEHLTHTALIQFLDKRTVNLPKVFDGEKIPIADTCDFYLGLYSGSIYALEKEASGILFYSLPDLKVQMKEHPELFTDDLMFFLERYDEKIDKFLKILA